jgi:hypothetical protein
MMIELSATSERGRGARRREYMPLHISYRKQGERETSVTVSAQASSVIIAMNSFSSISPSWSRSNSSIIAWLFQGSDSECEKRTRRAYSSSSSSRSPISLATRRRLRMEILPVLSSSKSWNARRISSIGSRARIRSLTAISQLLHLQAARTRQSTY